LNQVIGIVCGLQSEAKAVRSTCDDERIRLGVSGANASRAERIASDFCAKGASVIISVGVSGGLDPELQPGDLLIGNSVATGLGEHFDCDQELLQGASGLSQLPVVLYGADEIIASTDEKTVLFNKYKAVAVDMESHGAARAAKVAGVPFLAIRAIADPADYALPPAAMNAVAPDGSTRILKTLFECVKAPGQFPALLKLGANSEKALKTLRSHLPAHLKAVRDNL